MARRRADHPVGAQPLSNQLTRRGFETSSEALKRRNSVTRAHRARTNSFALRERLNVDSKSLRDKILGVGMTRTGWPALRRAMTILGEGKVSLCRAPSCCESR